MHVLRIEHRAPDYEAWKRAFDSDPVGREASGVRAYRILRAVDDPAYVLIDLEFDTAVEASAMLGGLREVWARVQGAIVESPQARITEIAESHAY